MPLRKLLFTAHLVGVLLLAGCGLGPNPARATLQATASPPPPASATETFPPTATEIPPTATASPTAAAPGADTATPAATTTPAAGSPVPPGTAQSGVDKAEFVADVTVPDGTNFTPGEAFVKTWRIKNVGTNTWGADYLLVFAKGEQMGGPQTVALPGRVGPDETVEVSVNMTAPDRLGSYTGFWQFRTPAGQPFGIGSEANQPLYVQINVTPGASGSPGPTSAAAGALKVTGATLTVDRPSITGACPQTIIFSLALTSEGGGTTSYRLEATTNTPGFTLTLPETTQSTFTGAGPRTFNASYTLTFSGSVSGQMWVHVLSPENIESNKVSFSLTCAPATATAVP